MAVHGMGTLRKRLIPLAAVLLVLATAGIAIRAQPASAAANPGPGFPTHYFAPYTDTGLNSPVNMTQTAQNVGVKFWSMAFIINGLTSCQATWNGNTPVTQGFMQSDINSLRALGGDITVSFGGAAGIELGQQCQDVASVQREYQSVVTNYALTHVDFDIEGAAVADPTSIDRRDKAIAGLQHANPGLVVSFTLPVLPTGLTQDGINLLQNAINNGVNIGVVNVMAMDYGSSFPANQMGQNAIQAGDSLFNQLKSLFPSRTTAQLRAMEGVTIMIGVNDVQPEVTTKQDAQMVESWAVQNGITELSYWSAARDQPCPGGATGGSASATCSGVTQQPFDFARILNPFTSGSVTPTPTPTASATPTPTPRPSATPTATPTPTPPPPPAGNLLSNPGFETGTLAGWTCEPIDSVVRSPVHSGSFALSAAADSANFAQCTQTVSVQPNHTYTYSAWVQGNYAFIGVVGAGTSNFAPSAPTFTKISIQFTTGASQTSMTVFIHGWYAQGTVFADDLSVS